MDERTRYEIEANDARRFVQTVFLAIDGLEAARNASDLAPLGVDYKVGDLLPIVSDGVESIYRVRKTDRREEIEGEGTLSRSWIVYLSPV